MPIRQAGILESLVSTWPRDHFCLSTIVPRPSRPTTCNKFLPISIPITAITLLSFSVLACSFRWMPLASLLADRRQEHGRTIPLADERHSQSGCVSGEAFAEPDNGGSALEDAITLSRARQKIFQLPLATLQRLTITLYGSALSLIWI